MNASHLKRLLRSVFLPHRIKLPAALALLALSSTWALSANQPSNNPLLSRSAGAKPNVMLVVDNTESMANPFTFDYNIDGTNRIDTRPWCPGPTYKGKDGFDSFADSNGKCDMSIGQEPVWSTKGATFPSDNRPADSDGYCRGPDRMGNGGTADYMGGTWSIGTKGYHHLGNTIGAVDKDRKCRYIVRYDDIWIKVDAPNLKMKPGDEAKNSPWHAMRNSIVNPVFYDPRIEYKPRVDQFGNVSVDSVDYPNITWVSNQETVRFRYCVSGYNVDPNVTDPTKSKKGLRHIYSYRQTPGMVSMDNSCAVDLLIGNENLGIGANEGYSPLIHDRNARLYQVPKLLSHASSLPRNDLPAFTYMRRCDDIYYDFQLLEGEPWNTVKGCKAKDMFKPGTSTWEYDMVELKANELGKLIDLPSNHQRTDCAQSSANKCTVQEEMRNVINWYRWYYSVGAATSTTIGRVLANPDYQGRMRLGYYNTVLKRNVLGNPEKWDEIVAAVEVNDLSPKRNRPVDMRGVRDTAVPANNVAVYNWLYKTLASPYSSAALPLRAFNRNINAIDDYFSSNDADGNPWANDPTKPVSSSNPTLSCRRSFMVFISNMDYLITLGGADDKAWDNKSYNVKNNTGYNHLDSTQYNSAFPFTGYDAEGTRYKDDARKRRLYTPFTTPEWGTGNDGFLRMSKKTARLYWHKDYLPGVANNIKARDGQPTTWQNLTTYTLGYMIRPSGEIAHSNGRGLTFKQIEEHKREWLLNGTMNKRPAWVRPWAVPAGQTGSVGFLANPRGHIDDFIQAGYTGGGAGFAVMSPTDMERAFDRIISEIIAHQGDDAGVSVSGLSSAESLSLSGRLVYKIGYDLGSNAGSLKAVRLNQANQAEDDVAWSTDDVGAFRGIPERNSSGTVAAHVPDQHREFFFMNGGVPASMNGASTSGSVGGPVLFGNDATIDHTKPNFVRYLLGDNTEETAHGGLWRQRNSPFMAASVNSAPVFIQGRLNMGYANPTADVGTANPQEDYTNYFKRKYKRPATIYNATNAGLVHVFDAGVGDSGATPFAASQEGREIAAYLLRGTAKKLPTFASPANKFQYLADGPLVEHDIYDGTNKAWRNIVFGTLGRGGKGLFALEAPLAAGPSGGATAKPSQSQFLWERDDNANNEWGYISNNPQAGVNDAGIAMLVTTTGHYVGQLNSDGSSSLNKDKVGLAVINPLTGALLKHIATPDTRRVASGPMGLGGVTLIRNEKKQVVGAYAGDELGNLWRFYLGGSAAGWVAKKVFSTPVVTPIYAAPAWQTHPGSGATDPCREDFTAEAKGSCGNIVVFGTGRLLEDADQNNSQQNYLVGVWDMTPLDWTGGASSAAFTPSSWGDKLQERHIDLSSETAGVKPGPEVSEDLFYKMAETDSSHNKVTVDWTRDAYGQPHQRGWYLELGQLGPHVQGERVISDLMNIGNAVFASGFALPSNMNEESCTAQSVGASVLYVVDALTGGHRRAFSKDQGPEDVNHPKKGEFSVMYLPKGGMARGLNMTEVMKPKDKGVDDYLMQILTEGGGDPKEGRPERTSLLNPPALNPGAIICGSGACVAIEEERPSRTGWRRSWRQIITLPETLR